MPSRSNTPVQTPKGTKRKSWFALSRKARTPTTNATNDKSPPPPPSAFDKHPNLSADQSTDTRAGPLQFSPNRLQTLYISSSERDLYMAAMSQLDQGVQPLPLWTDPAPTLPQLPVSPTIDPSVEIMQNGQIGPPNPTGRDVHPLTTLPLSPKLVTSPNLPGSGLMIRDEFRRPHSPSKATRHALMTLLPTSFLRFTGFAPKTVLAVDRTMVTNWPLGVWLRSEEMEQVQARTDGDENWTWRAELHGRAWKRKGSQELDSIRLLLAILTTLSTHGWRLVGSVQAAGLKSCHNLLFRYDPQFEAHPPAFFALSLPLADRLSLISVPSKTTPAVLTAVRSAITANSHLTSRSKKSSAEADANPPPEVNKRLTWGSEGKAKGIKVEGWVHPGVYRFWIAGMRKWLGGAVRNDKVDNLHPQLLTSIMNHLSSIHFELAGSIPLLPLAKGRDVLYFYSLPGSGLSHLDTYRPDATAGATSSESDSPVLVSPTNSVLAAAPVGHSQQPTSSTENEQGTARVLPWSSILADDPPTSPARVQKASKDPRNMTSPPPSIQQAHPRLRTVSRESSQRLIPASAQSSPRPRNVLLKKNSLNRQQRTASETQSVDLPPTEGHIAPATPELGTDTADETRNSGQWSMVNVPAHVGRLGMTQYDYTDDQNAQRQAPPLPPRHTARPDPPRRSTDDVSAESVYDDYQDSHERPSLHHPHAAQADPAPVATYHPAHYHFHPPDLALGNAVNHDNLPVPVESVPLRDPDSARRAGSAVVDVGSGIGVRSMHGSVGYMPTQSMVSLGRSDVGSAPPPVPAPRAGSTRTKISLAN